MTKKCSFCAEEIQEEAVKCKHCGSILPQQVKSFQLTGFGKLKTKTLTPKELKARGRTANVIGAIALVLIIISAVVISNTGSPSSAPTSPAPAPDTQHVSLGNQGFLRSANSPHTIVAVSKASYDELFKALSANDSAGYDQLANAGEVFSVDSGSKVLVIDSSWGVDQVRFVDGPHTGETAWISGEMVKPN